jgi:hypothetical protein
MIEPPASSELPSAWGHNLQSAIRNLQLTTVLLEMVEPVRIERDGVLTPAQSAICNQPI